MPPTMTLAMSHPFKPEVEVLEKGLEGGLEVLEGELEGFEGLGVEPGASSGESIKVRRGCETPTEERDKGEISHHRRHTTY